MFRAPLCPSPGAQEYYTVVAACGISCCKITIYVFTARNTTGSNHRIIVFIFQQRMVFIDEIKIMTNIKKYKQIDRKGRIALILAIVLSS